MDCKPVTELTGTVLGKYKAKPDFDDKYAKYVSLKKGSVLNDHTLVYGASGTGKSRGFVRPFILQTVKRRESLILVDPKGEFYESLSEYLRENGYVVKVFNLLDMENSDGFNVMGDIESDINLVTSIADVIIHNTSNGREQSSDFWDKAELNLLMALIHYVQSQLIPGTKRLLPIEERSLGTIYKMLSRESFAEIEERFAALPKNHPAQGTYGIFKLAPRNIWGNIATGLGTRLTVFQNEIVDRITAYDEIDMTLPGQEPCAYFCVIPDQENPYEFLSSLFFSTLFSRLTDYARRNGERGRLPVAVNVCLDEFCNIGDFGFKRLISTVRSKNLNCQVLVQGVSQLENRYPHNEWQEIVANCDCQIYLGGNDNLTAKYISEKCGKVTIAIKNNQMPLTPLFSPVYSSTRPYSQTKSNTQRDLMLPDEVLRLPNEQCLVMLRGQKPLLLYKIVPEEFKGYDNIQTAHITGHIPQWRQAMETPAVPSPPIPTGKTPQTADPMQSPKTPASFREEVTETQTLPNEQYEQTNLWQPIYDYSIIDDEPESQTEETSVPSPGGKYGALQHMGETSPQGILDDTINDLED
jgi:type IV secretion system protein VirD4